MFPFCRTTCPKMVGENSATLPQIISSSIFTTCKLGEEFLEPNWPQNIVLISSAVDRSCFHCNLAVAFTVFFLNFISSTWSCAFTLSFGAQPPLCYFVPCTEENLHEYFTFSTLTGRFVKGRTWQLLKRID